MLMEMVPEMSETPDQRSYWTTQILTDSNRSYEITHQYLGGSLEISQIIQ